MAASTYIPTNSVGWFTFLHTLSSICICGLINDGHSDLREVVAHQTFDFFGFFDKYKDHIVASSSIDQYNAILKYKNLLDEKMKNR